jgi:hypothetical protein
MTGSGLETFRYPNPSRCGLTAVMECDERVKRAVVAPHLTSITRSSCRGPISGCRRSDRPVLVWRGQSLLGLLSRLGQMAAVAGQVLPMPHSGAGA